LLVKYFIMIEQKLLGGKYVVGFDNVNDGFSLKLIVNKESYGCAFTRDELINTVSYLKNNFFFVDGDYSIDPFNKTLIYITKWTADNIAHYCTRAWVNGTWSEYVSLAQSEISALTHGLESFLTESVVKPKELPKMSVVAIPKKELPPVTDNAELNNLKNEMLKFLDGAKTKMRKG